MRQYLISTDTTADLTDDFVRENSIDIHTLFYAFGEQLYGPGNEMPVKEFYTRMRNGEMPSTMACNPEDVAKIFKKRVAEGYACWICDKGQCFCIYTEAVCTDYKV